MVAQAMAAPSAIEDSKKKIKEGKFDEAVAGLEAEIKKKPKDASLKAALSEAYLAHGESLMFNKDLPPMRKYPESLRKFRKAVEADASNRKAKDHINTIEGIYKSMGRPVPQ
jgi:tetratricopeptide (TPR) repeat protein